MGTREEDVNPQMSSRLGKGWRLRTHICVREVVGGLTPAELHPHLPDHGAGHVHDCGLIQHAAAQHGRAVS